MMKGARDGAPHPSAVARAAVRENSRWRQAKWKRTPPTRRQAHATMATRGPHRERMGDITDERHVRASKLLAHTLRHRPAELGVELDEHGWAHVGPLIRSMADEVEFSREILEHIVATVRRSRGTGSPAA